MQRSTFARGGEISGRSSLSRPADRGGPRQRQRAALYTAEPLERRLLMAVDDIADGPNVLSGAGGPHRTIGTVDFNTLGILDPRINVGTADEDRPRVALTDDGGFIMVWTQSTGTSNVMAQFFKANGDGLGAFDITPAASPAESQPDIATIPGLGYGIVYVQSDGAGSSNLRVSLSNDGSNTETGDVNLSNAGTVAELNPTITFLGGIDDTFLVTWEVAGASDTDIYGQRVNADGSLVDANPVLLRGTADNFDANDNPTPHGVAPLGDGSVAVTWVEALNVKVQRFTFDLTGGTVHTLDEGALNDRTPAVAALAGGGFVAVWEADRPLDPSLLWGQLFTAAGELDGTAFELTGDIPALETDPSVSGLPDGGFAVTWIGNDGPNNTDDVRLRTFDADGTARGDAFPVTFTGFTPHPDAAEINENDHTVTAMPDGRLLVSWVDPSPDSDTDSVRASQDDILYQIFDPGNFSKLQASDTATTISLPTTFFLFDDDGSETLDMVVVQGLSDYGHSLVVGHQDQTGEIDPGNFLELPWVIQRGFSVEETALLDGLIDDPANHHVVIQLSGANPGLFNFGIFGTTKESFNDATRASLSRAVNVEFVGVPNTPPTAADVGPFTGAEDAATRVEITLSGDDADAGDAVDSFTIATLPANGSLFAAATGGSALTAGASITATGSGPYTGKVFFQPDADFNGNTSFTYTAFDGVASSSPAATASITITEVNDAPTGADDPLTAVLEDSGQRTISFASLLGNDSKGPSNESGQALTITAVDLPVGGSVSIQGTDVLFTPTTDFNGAASFRYTLRDDGKTNGVDDFKTSTANVNFTVTAVNDEPSFTKGPNQTHSTSGSEQIISVTNWATSISVGPADEAAVQSPSFLASNDNPALFTAQPAISGNGTLTYTIAANATGSATVTVTLMDDGGTDNGGDDTSPSQTFTINVGVVAVAPALSGLATSVTFLENTVNAAFQRIDADVTLSDTDSPDFAGGNVTVAYVAGGGAQDQLGVGSFGGISRSGANVLSGATVIGTIPGSGAGSGVNGNSLIITLNASATPAIAELLIEALTYANNSHTPAAARTVAVTVNDGDGQTSDPQNTVINVTPENDAPVNTVPGAVQNAVTGGTRIFRPANGNALSVADVDAASANVQVNFSVNAGTLTLLSTTGLGVTGNNTASVTATGTIAAINAALGGTNGLRFNATAGSQGNVTLTMVTDDLGNTPTPAQSDTDTVNIVVRGAGLVTDPVDGTKQALLISGTSGNDSIVISPAAGGQVQVNINGTNVGTFNPTGSIIALGHGGNDRIEAVPTLAREVMFFGGTGNDTLVIGNGGGILVGGNGTDNLYSANARDLHIGGAGNDRLKSGKNDDLLIAGSTAYDEPTNANIAALAAIHREWKRTDQTYTQRINHLTGATGGGLNGANFLKGPGAGQSVFNDTQIDTLLGEAGTDWFFADPTGTSGESTDRNGVEQLVDL